ncbi:MAG: amidase [Pelistega sp.]|nr:amidase [Pelistega sp.]
MTKTIMALLSDYKSRKVSPLDEVKQQLLKIEASPLNAFITVLPEQAKHDAQCVQDRISAGDSLRSLEGITIAIKDLIDVEGIRTTMGAESYVNNIAKEDAEVIRLLKHAGAIIIGKANTHQFAYGATGDRSYFGPVRNPKDSNRISGGSSSGSVAAVASGLVHIAIGTDTSASIRLPAALCGVVGMKPTLGLVSKQGVFNLSETLDHVGPISRSVEDNAILLEVIADKPVGTYSRKIGQSIKGLIVCVPKEFYGEYVSTAVKVQLEKAIEKLKAAGAEIRHIEIANIYEIYQAQQLILKTEAYATHEDMLEAQTPYIQEVKDRLLTGKDVLASEYLRRKKLQYQAQASFDDVLASVDVILTATCGITAPLLDERSTEINGQMHPTQWLLTRLTAPTNFSGHPSLSVPFGEDDKGLPIGLQLIGRMHDEATVYQFGEVLER